MFFYPLKCTLKTYKTKQIQASLGLCCSFVRIHHHLFYISRCSLIISYFYLDTSSPAKISNQRFILRTTQSQTAPENVRIWYLHQMCILYKDINNQHKDYPRKKLRWLDLLWCVTAVLFAFTRDLFVAFTIGSEDWDAVEWLRALGALTNYTVFHFTMTAKVNWIKNLRELQSFHNI